MQESHAVAAAHPPMCMTTFVNQSWLPPTAPSIVKYGNILFIIIPTSLTVQLMAELLRLYHNVQDFPPHMVDVYIFFLIF